MSYRTFNYYEKVAALVADNKNVDVVNGFKKQGFSTKCVGWSCWISSCMCCCCFSKVAGACIDTASLGSNWQSALEAYDGLTNKQTKKLFLDSIQILQDIRKTIAGYIVDCKNKMDQAASDGQVMNYTGASIKYSDYLSYYTNGQWIVKIMSKIQSESSYTKNYLTEGIQFDFGTLTSVQVITLIASLGFYYPVSYNKYMIKFNPAEINLIRSCADVCLNINNNAI
jgi:hypothetical protein